MRSKLLLSTACLFAAAVFIAVCRRDPQIQIHRVARHVEGFALEGDALFGPGYAAWANYKFFTYRGETYERLPGGAVIIRRGETRSTDFMVREDLISKDWAGRPEQSKLSVIDQKTGETIASRYLREGEVEDGRGWVGEHAVKFIRKVLIPDRPIGGAIGVEPYPQLATEVELLALEEVRPELTSILDCPTDFLLEGYPKMLTTASWRFCPQSPLSTVVCAHNTVAVFSNPFPPDIYVDVLSLNGQLLAQAALKVPVSYDLRLVRVDHLVFDGSDLFFTVHYAKNKFEDGTFRWIPQGGSRVHLRFPDGKASSR